MARKSNLSKRELILESAIHVFSEKTYERTRINDIARHAGIAYGLVYHYFENKEEILRCIFQEKWAIFVGVLRQIDESPDPLEEKLYYVANFLLQGTRIMPELMRLIMVEINRRVQILDDENLRSFGEVFSVVEAMLRRHQERGEIHSERDPRLLAYLYFGGMEALILGHIYGQFPHGTVEELEQQGRISAKVFMEGIRP